MGALVRFGQFLLKNPWQASLVVMALGVTPLLGLPFFAWIGAVIIGLVTLRNGYQEGAMVLGFSAIAPLVFGVVQGDFFLFLHQVVVGALVVYLFAWLLRATGDWRVVLESAVWLGVLCVLMAYFFVDDLQAWWMSRIHEVFTEAGRLSGQPINDKQPLLAYEIALLLPIINGFTAAWMLMINMVNMGIARWWQGKMFNPVGLRKELLNLRLGLSLVVGLVVCLLAARFLSPIGWDFVPIFVAAFLVSGLSFIHAYFENRQPRQRGLILILYYVCFILMAPYVVGFTVLIGVSDSVLDLRKRLVKQ